MDEEEGRGRGGKVYPDDEKTPSPDEKKKKGLFDQMKDKSSDLKKNLTERLADVKEEATTYAEKVKDEAMSTRIGQEMSKGLKYIDSSAKALLRTVKDEINKWVRGQIEKNVRGLMRKHAPVFLKKKLKDPAMCDCVKKTVDDIVDAIWPEIETEIMMKLNYALYPIEEYPLEEVENGWLLCLCVKIRAWYRYTSDPVDKTIWNQIRWFSWWVLTITKMIPFYFVQPGFFILHFFLMDMTDEFQCIAYILKFKGLQFLSAGVIKGLIGFTQYYICVNYQDPKNGEHNCHNSGPGSSTNVLVELLSFLFMIAFVWLAALVMLCSKTKGAARFQYQDTSAEKPKNGCCCCFHPANVKGGRIWCFMMFDAVVFLMCAIAFLIVARFLSVKDKEWQLQADIYFCQFAYGILSFPFNLFAVAFFKTLVIKCRPTGYDKLGRCVPKYVAYTNYIKKYGAPSGLSKEAKEKAAKKEAERKTKKDIIEVDDMEEML